MLDENKQKRRAFACSFFIVGQFTAKQNMRKNKSCVNFPELDLA